MSCQSQNRGTFTLVNDVYGVEQGTLPPGRRESCWWASHGLMALEDRNPQGPRLRILPPPPDARALGGAKRPCPPRPPCLNRPSRRADPTWFEGAAAPASPSPPLWDAPGGARAARRRMFWRFRGPAEKGPWHATRAAAGSAPSAPQAPSAPSPGSSIIYHCPTCRGDVTFYLLVRWVAGRGALILRKVSRFLPPGGCAAAGP